MSIDKATVTRIAHLANIRVEEADKETIAREFDSILAFVDELKEVDTSKVPPLTSVVETHLTMRADAVTDGDMPQQILANAPKAAAHFFVVPKVVE